MTVALHPFAQSEMVDVHAWHVRCHDFCHLGRMVPVMQNYLAEEGHAVKDAARQRCVRRIWSVVDMRLALDPQIWLHQPNTGHAARAYDILSCHVRMEANTFDEYVSSDKRSLLCLKCEAFWLNMRHDACNRLNHITMVADEEQVR